MSSNGTPGSGNAGDSGEFSRPGRSNSLGRVKQTSDQSPGRLPSLRGPRDLTLGGIKKKTFTPTIPQRKERIKPDPSKDDAKPAKPNKSKRDRCRDGRNRGRGRGRGGFQKQEIIQSHSIFEAGPGAETTNRGRESFASAAEPAPQILKPTIKKESFDALQLKIESDEVMKKLDEGNTSLILDLQNDEKLRPIALPMYSTPQIPAIKHEPVGSMDIKENIVRDNPNITSPIFQSSEEQLMLFQIPDTVPGIPPSKDAPSIMVKQEPGVSSVKQEPVEQNQENDSESICGIDQLSEGPIGKLQIMKSGKCKLVLGGITLDLKIGTPSSFAEELVSIRLPPDGSPDTAKGHLSVLGNVENKVVCIPDMSSLIEPR
ncbi:DNA-directed RNA polymerase III subunit RPC4-like isoform X1 [Clavelina lepadiformis]|uniref:DNA-directed RNA polymerase III subunit RPC4-like isoform X1 n=1 Tax=Clavelina lepadiformis TaxID=159417 RepID=UPI0040413B5B